MKLKQFKALIKSLPDETELHIGLEERILPLVRVEITIPQPTATYPTPRIVLS